MPFESLEKPMSRDKAREAFQNGDQETFYRWLDARRVEADQDPTGRGRFLLEIDLAQIEHSTGRADKAIERLRAVVDGAEYLIESLERSTGQETVSDVPHLQTLERMREIKQGAELLMKEFSQ